MSKENTVNDDNKIKKSKKIKLIIMLLILLVLFIWYGIYLNNSNTQSNDYKVISYLENKYNQKFEIIQLVEERQYENPAISCDGSTFVPARKVKDKYEYDYEVLSKSDNIKFNVYYLNDKGTDSFKDSYIECKNVTKSIEEISNYIVCNIGDTTLEKEIKFVERPFSLTYDCDIDIYLNEKIDEILEQNYINRLQSIRIYINSIIDSFTRNYCDIYNTNSDTFIVFKVYIHYQDGKYTKINEASTLYVFNENSTSGIDINSYWRNLND